MLFILSIRIKPTMLTVIILNVIMLSDVAPGCRSIRLGRENYHCTVGLLFDWFGISCMTTDNFCFYLQNRQIQTSQTGGQWYSDTSPWTRVATFFSDKHASLLRQRANCDALSFITSSVPGSAKLLVRLFSLTYSE
jgi:hypothetical protein